METGIVRDWVEGWALSRGTPAPVEEPWGLRIEVGLPHHVTRHILAGADPAVLSGLMASVTVPGTWLKVFAPVEEVTASLTPGWTVEDPGHLMAVRLSKPHLTPADGYETRVSAQGATTEVLLVTPDGERAASGRLAQTGSVAVFDMIMTEPGHRRRGLGSQVMNTLAALATGEGAETGLLVATDEGMALYRSLGWEWRGPMTNLAFELAAASA